ncbi:MAG: nuclear transport factor 2 family protein [Pseudonocardia sp.]
MTQTEHPALAATLHAFAALAAGDAGPADALMADDIVNINDIGAGPWRENRGKDAVWAFFGAFVELFEGEFHQDLVDARMWGEDRVVLFVHEHGTARGVPFDNRAVYVLDVVDGQWAALRTFDLDPARCEGFWVRVGTSVASHAGAASSTT